MKKQVKRHLRILLPLMFGLLVAVGVISVKRISDIRDYGKLINYVGIVRGASQRAVKLATNGRPADELISYVDGIVDELLTGQGSYGLVQADGKAYQECLLVLRQQWETVKNEMTEVMQGATGRSFWIPAKLCSILPIRLFLRSKNTPMRRLPVRPD